MAISHGSDGDILYLVVRAFCALVHIYQKIIGQLSFVSRTRIAVIGKNITGEGGIDKAEVRRFSRFFRLALTARGRAWEYHAGQVR